MCSSDPKTVANSGWSDVDCYPAAALFRWTFLHIFLSMELEGTRDMPVVLLILWIGFWQEFGQSSITAWLNLVPITTASVPGISGVNIWMLWNFFHHLTWIKTQADMVPEHLEKSALYIDDDLLRGRLSYLIKINLQVFSIFKSILFD